jgi:Leucine-rich repeat (LRR) protein
MNAMPSWMKRHQIAAVAFSFLMLALVAGTTGCVGETSSTVKYDLTIASGEGGSVSVPGEGTFRSDAGRVVDLVAVPTSGYRFDRWTGNVDTIANVNTASTTITMNGDYSITATFEETEGTYYTLTVGVTGSGSTSPTVGQHTYAAGTVVSIIATPASGYQFVGWSGHMDTIANVNAASTTITMNDDYSIIANFEQTVVTYYALTMAVTGSGSTSPTVGQHTYTAGTVVHIIATPAGGNYFVNWTGNVGTIANVNGASTTITMSGNYSITANFQVAVPYTLTMAVTGGGSTSPAVGQHIYTAGTPVAITATPTVGYSFVNWTAPEGSFTNANSASTTFTMPAQSVTVTANFVEGPPAPPGQYTLTMAVAGSGSTSPAVGQHNYAGGTMIAIVATPAGGYRFVNWTAPAGSLTDADSASTTFTMPAQAVTVTAHFEAIPPVQYSLTISSTTGGSVTTPGEGTFVHNAGAVVNLAATPGGGYAFVNWTGNVATVADVNAAYTTISVNGNYSITANFVLGDWVFFSDANFEAALREALNKPTGHIYKSDLEGLTSFTATHRSISELSGLEYCINLISLDLRDNQISDISPLASLTKLEWLDLSYNEISNVSPLATLTNLKWLYLYDNEIVDISPVTGLTNLLYLYVQSNQIGDISPLASLTNLRRLLLFTNQISDISPLASLTKLQWLYLHENQISDISPLVSLTNLTQLDVSDNQVSGIGALGNLTKLAYLSLHSNQISDISPLASLTSLIWLYLQHNDISNIYPLVQNGGLGAGDEVYLGTNPLSDDSINIYIPELVGRGVAVSY